MKEVGQYSAAVNLQNEVRKEERRMRRMSGQDADLLRALTRHRDADEEASSKRRRLVDDANAATLSAALLKQHIKDSNAKLRATRNRSPKRKHSLRLDMSRKRLRSRTLAAAAIVASLRQGRLACACWSACRA